LGAGIGAAALLASRPLEAATKKAVAGSPADQAFADLAVSYLGGIARLNPVGATSLGDHRFDESLPDMSAKGRAAQLVFMKDMAKRLAKIDRKGLSRDNQVDAALLANDINGNIWQIEVEKGWSWNPQIYQGTAGSALYSLAARDYAPWDARLKAATARMEKLPALYAQMRAELIPAKVPQVYAETVSKQNMGTLDTVTSVLEPQSGVLTSADKARFDAAVTGLKAALAVQQDWLEKTLVPQAKGDFRLDTAIYDRKLAFAMVGAITRQEIKARATKSLAETRAEMYGIARLMLAGRAGAPATPSEPSPQQEQAAIAAALELA
jgi:uncharacterized protein (DUF885 family)